MEEETQTQEEVKKEKKPKINLYPDKELEDIVKQGAKKVDRSVNKFCLMILKRQLIDNKRPENETPKIS